VAESLAGLLEGAGAQVVNLLPGASMVEALAGTGAAQTQRTGVIFACGLEPDVPVDGVEAMNKQCRLGAELVEVYRQLVAGKTQPRLWILTAGAVAVDPADEVGNPFQAALWGLGRVAMNECPDVETILLDLPAQSPGGLAADVYSELCSGASGEERALRESGRYVHALSRLVPEEMERGAERDIVARGGSFRLQAAAGAGIENLHLTEVASIRPAAGEVLIDIHAIGLNFKDVMNATGLLSDEAVAGGRAGKSLGLECSGVIRELGAGVTGMAPGDRVMALAADCLGGQVSVDARHVLPIPSLFSMEEAAGVPVVYMTAY
jgi:hypothetical protein